MPNAARSPAATLRFTRPRAAEMSETSSTDDHVLWLEKFSRVSCPQRVSRDDWPPYSIYRHKIPTRSPRFAGRPRACPEIPTSRCSKGLDGHGPKRRSTERWECSLQRTHAAHDRSGLATIAGSSGSSRIVFVRRQMGSVMSISLYEGTSFEESFMEPV